MPIVVAVLLMVLLIATGKHSRRLGLGQYLVILIITLAQVAFFIVYLYTMEKPPVYWLPSNKQYENSR